ncbi:MAG: DUF4919 domain-containing protein [Bacteroidetes bacterium]|nr:DUF4919 domain-containing protein [Bacteroidota bacterium]
MKHSTFKLLMLIAGLILGNFYHGTAQVDNYAKNKKISEDAAATYNKELKKDPESALPHWRYANIVAEFTFNEYKDAWKYYLKALDIDSTNADIYYDFSNYLADRLSEIEDAKAVCEKGLSFAPDNQKLKSNLKRFDELIEKNNEMVRLYSFNKTDKRSIPHNIEYSVIANIDSLNKVVTDDDSGFKYEMLLADFNNEKSLTDYQVYLLLIGYTQTDNYNPYNYNAIDTIYSLAIEGQIDEAIKNGEELLKSNPLNPSLNRELMYCYRKKGDENKAEYYHRRMLTVFSAMLYTGQGTCEKPYVTFWVREEYNFARHLGLTPTGQYSTGMCTGGMADKLETYNPMTEENEFIYFNIMPIVKKTMQK